MLRTILSLGSIGIIVYLILFTSDEDIKNIHNIIFNDPAPVISHASEPDLIEIIPDQPMYVLQPEKSK